MDSDVYNDDNKTFNFDRGSDNKLSADSPSKTKNSLSIENQVSSESPSKTKNSLSYKLKRNLNQLVTK